MTNRRALWIAVFLAILLPLTTQPSRSSIGLAEWQIYTPGGNLILHADTWKTDGDCLKGDDADMTLPSNRRDRVYVSHLRRWRYYKDFIAGENRLGFFLFHEVSKQVKYFSSEQTLLQGIARQGLGKPKSNWLTSSDGWTEAWFPTLVWQPCQELLNPSSNRHGNQTFSPLSREQCRQAVSEASLSLYRETTWGRECQKFKAAPIVMRQQQPELQTFCEHLLSVP